MAVAAWLARRQRGPLLPLGLVLLAAALVPMTPPTSASVISASVTTAGSVAPTPSLTGAQEMAVPVDDEAPTIIEQTQRLAVRSGQTATLTVSADGTEPFSYTWYEGPAGDTGKPVLDATEASLVTGPLTVSTSFWVRVRNDIGSADSTVITVTVLQPPQIIRNPAGTSVLPGQTATLSMVAAGSAPLTYQWFEGVAGDTTKPVTGATKATLVTSPLTVSKSFWVRVNNTVGTADSADATVTVLQAPQITAQPEGVTLLSGQTATLRVIAAGSAPLAYQWFEGAAGDTTKPVTGATKATLVTSPLTVSKSFWVRVNNTVGTADSTSAAVTVLQAPQITAQPEGVTFVSGQTATLSVIATGSEPLAYQWFEGVAGDTTKPVTDATSPTLVTGPLTASKSFWVRVNNTVGTADSASAAVTVLQAPQITAQPEGVTFVSGQTATLSVIATGSEPLAYQWFEGVAGDTTKPVTDATSPTLVTDPLTVSRSFWVRVNNTVGTADSTDATVTVLQAPQITAQPASTAVLAGKSATLTVIATSPAPFAFQWYEGARGDIGMPIVGATAATLVTRPLAGPALFWVRVNNAAGSIDSATTRVAMLAPPRITRHPVGTTLLAGETATLGVTATGTAPLSFQWYEGTGNGGAGRLITGATAASFSTPPLARSTLFRVRVSNAAGITDSSAAEVFVLAPPQVTLPPASLRLPLGSRAVFTAGAEGSGPFSYQWRKNGNDIPGALDTTLVIEDVLIDDGGSYSVLVRNAAGSTESDPAVLEIELPALAMSDDFAARPVFTELEFTGTANNLHATHEPGEPFHAGKPGTNSLWLTWVAPQSGLATFSTAGSTFDTVLTLYTGTTFAGIQSHLVASDDDRGGFLTSLVKFNAVAGTAYQVAIDGYAGAWGVIVLDWRLDVTAAPLPQITRQPVNQLAVLSNVVQFSVSALPFDVTYQWLRNNREIAGATQPTLSFVARPERVGTYRVRVTSPQGQSVESGDALLEVVDRLTTGAALTADKLEDLFLQETAPARVAWSSPGRLAGAPVSQGIPHTQYTDNSTSTASNPDPRPCGVITHATRWLRFRPEFDEGVDESWIMLSTEGSAIPVVLAVYKDRFNLTLVGCGVGTATPSTVYFTARRGEDYYVMVDGAGGARGLVKLNYQDYTEEVPEFAQPKIEAGILTIRRAVPPGIYQMDVADDVAQWTPVLRTNVSSGLFQYTDRQSASAPFEFFRLVPSK